MLLSIFKKPVIIGLIVVTTASGAYYLYRRANPGKVLGLESTLQEFTRKNIPGGESLFNRSPLETTLNETLAATSKELNTLGQKTIEVGNEVVNFVDEVKSSTTSTPLHERALEYGQYVYCQAVVKEYEQTAR